MIKTIAAWSALAILWAFALAGSWAIYDDCYSEVDYNVICRKATMGIRATAKKLLVRTQHAVAVKSPSE